VKGALCPSNAKMLYTDKKSTEKGEIKSRRIGERERERGFKEKLCCYFV